MVRGGLSALCPPEPSNSPPCDTPGSETEQRGRHLYSMHLIQVPFPAPLRVPLALPGMIPSTEVDVAHSNHNNNKLKSNQTQAYPSAPS